MKPRLIVILGPTATGKSACGIRLAQQLNGEIISGDSMLVYRTMDIATAKPTASELGSVPHHLVDILEPTAEFSVMDFKSQAERLIPEINQRGQLPILVGGTGLYIKALIENYNFSTVTEHKELRAELEEFAAKHGAEALHGKLQAVAPLEAARLHVNDQRRIIRAIEVALEGEQVNQDTAQEWPYDAVVFGLRMPRELLYARINKRVELMVEQGILEETKRLLAAGVPPTALAMRSIGYKQIVDYLQGAYSWETCISKLQQATRHFAKRQLTWYKKMPYVEWIDVEEGVNPDKYVKVMVEKIAEHYKIDFGER